MILEGKIALYNKQQLNATSSNPVLKSNKEGDIKKCPACNAPTQSFSIKCAECGHEYRNIESSNSVKEFFRILNELESSNNEESDNPFIAFGNTYAKLMREGGIFGGGKTGRQKTELIKNFPIPNTKEDILEFLALGVPRAKKKGNFFSSSFSDGAWEIKSHNYFVPVWQSKCEQIIIKARFSLKDDKSTLAEIEFYANQLGIK
jgi:hypothetical protein